MACCNASPSKRVRASPDISSGRGIRPASLETPQVQGILYLARFGGRLGETDWARSGAAGHSIGKTGIPRWPARPRQNPARIRVAPKSTRAQCKRALEWLNRRTLQANGGGLVKYRASSPSRRNHSGAMLHRPLPPPRSTD